MKIDPKMQYCSCGYAFLPSTFQKVVMLIKGQYIKTCPKCGTKMTLKLISHVICSKREIIKNKSNLWKNP